MSGPPEELMKRWLHSHEEDTQTERVYRPSTYSFGPSRGRMGFELRPDGSCTWIGISPRDGSAEQGCRWEHRRNAEEVLTIELSGGNRQELQVVSLDNDRLVVRR
jgi:hypothetical protein